MHRWATDQRGGATGLEGETIRPSGRLTGLLAAVALVSAALTVTASTGSAAAGTGRSGGEVFRSPASTPAGAAAVLPAGFQDSTVWSGIAFATAIAFSPGGKVYVAQKNGVIKVFASPAATSPLVF